MKIESLMTRNIVSVEMDDSLSVVKEVFENTNFHHLLVVEDSKLVGIISDRDLWKSISPNLDTIAATNKDFASLNKKVHQIMTRKLITLPVDAAIKEAVDLFNNNTISCIPIVNSVHKPVGILSWRDIMRIIGDRIGKSISAGAA